MKRISQEGYSLVELVIIIVSLCIVVGVGFYVFNNKSVPFTVTEPAAEEEQIAEETPQYLTITEWGVKIPLTEATSTATYHIQGNQAYLDVAIDGDVDNACLNQAILTKVTDTSEAPDQLAMYSSNVDGTYYMIEGSQAICSEDPIVQEQASAIRTAWTDQSQLITTE